MPVVSATQLAEWKSLSFPLLACRIFRLYIEEREISNTDLESLLIKSFSTFSHPEVAPLSKLVDGRYLLELFHGPTFAFKGNLFEYFLGKNKGKTINVLGATSGDTGGYVVKYVQLSRAAIYGLRGKKNVNVFILFPKGRVSNVQEAQMTSVPDANVYNVSVEGTFDNCQSVVKALFSDQEFRKEYRLAAVNSINWARILSQVVYYFYSYFRMQEIHPGVKIRYSVPSGNFGDILAGYFAVRMNLPIHRLIVATNANDILARFFATGEYQKTDDCHATLSPAMDILASSNFERLLWYLERGDSRTSATLADEVRASEQVVKHMSRLQGPQGGFKVDPSVLYLTRDIFLASCVRDEQTRECISRYYALQPLDDGTRVILDPHTAVGVVASERLCAEDTGSEETVDICLATAHPGKFPDAILSSVSSLDETMSAGGKLEWEDFAPQVLVEAMEMPKRCVHLSTKESVSSDKDVVQVATEKVKKYMIEKLKI
ncbi:MAG: hypothetical protein SGCHY_001250 [Lobulomycetales sp.]